MYRNDSKGSILILAVTVVFIVSGMVATLLMVSVSGTRREASRDLKFTSRELAEAALDLSLNNLSQATDGVDNNNVDGVDEGADVPDSDIPFGHFTASEVDDLEGKLGRIGTINWDVTTDDANGNGWPDFGEANVNPITFSGGQIFAFTLFSELDGIDNDNDTTTDEADEAGSVTAIAACQFNGVESFTMYSGIFTDVVSPPGDPTWTAGSALASGGDVIVQGSADVKGDYGDVHGNGDAIVKGSGHLVEGTISASGEVVGSEKITAPATWAEGIDEVAIPNINPEDYRSQADYILTAGGDVIDNATGLPVSGGIGGWTLNGGTWKVTGNNMNLDGVFFVEGDVKVTHTGSGGQGDLNFNQVTIICTGNADFAGNSNYVPKLDNLFLVTGGDIKFTGNVEMFQPGIILAREQIEVVGNATLLGNMMAADLDDQFTQISETKVSGSMDITCDDEMGTSIPVLNEDNRFILDPTFSAYEER